MYYNQNSNDNHFVNVVNPEKMYLFQKLMKHIKHINKSLIYKQIIVMYCGRCAEKVLLKDISTSASNDLEKAIDLAYLCYDKQ